MASFVRFLPLLILLADVPPGVFSQASPSLPPATTIDASVLTYHYDNRRSGLNARETTLTQSNVNEEQFGKTAFYTLDGKVHAQPLYIAETTGTLKHHYLFAATEHDSLYKIDLDTGRQVWKISLLGKSEKPAPATNVGETTELGITATPVINLSAGPDGGIYAVAASIDTAGKYHQRLHALDLLTGAELFDGPAEITASYPGTGDNSSDGVVIFDPKQYIHRAGLLLANNTIYTTWSSRGDVRPYTGWVIAYSAATLKQTGVLNVTPNGHEGGIWMSGGAPAVDSEGKVYIVDGNGTFDTTFDVAGNPSHGDYGNTLFKLDTVAGKPVVADYYAPNNTYNEIYNDLDFGSSGVLLLPPLKDAKGKIWNLSVTASKEGDVYLNDLANLGKFHPHGGVVYQELDGVLPRGSYATPVYFNGTIYFGVNYGHMLTFTVADARITSAPPQSPSTFFGYTGPIPVISANGTKDGIVWALDAAKPEVLHAYKANDVSDEIYNSSQAPNGRDTLGAPFHFSTPIVVDGRVFVGTPTGVAVFGLLK